MVSEQIAREYAKKVDEVIKRKLIELSYKALYEREYKLYDILHEIEEGNINEKKVEQFKDKLNEEGYLLSVEMPEADISFDENSYYANMNPNEIKIKIYKEILSD